MARRRMTAAAFRRETFVVLSASAALQSCIETLGRCGRHSEAPGLRAWLAETQAALVRAHDLAPTGFHIEMELVGATPCA